MILGLTGGSGTGKSTACSFFESKGFYIIDSDNVAREVCGAGMPCLLELVQNFGDGIIYSDGSLKRKELGRIVFSDSEKLAALNHITHKYIIERIKNIIDDNKDRSIVIDAPLLFETGLDAICTKTLCILSLEESRIARITERDGISKEEAMARIHSQKDDDFYISRCDYVLYNDLSRADLMCRLGEIFGGVYGN